MNHFKKILAFQKLLKQFNAITRDVGSLYDSQKYDNDVEHSYRVAMLCWMIIDEYRLSLDMHKVVTYALIHDLVEVYAGDISLYDASVSSEKKKYQEHKSFLKLKKQFPQLKNIWKSLDAYEKRKDNESKFVYIIEKLEPILVVILSEQNHWIKRKVTKDTFFELKQKKIKDIDSFAQIFMKEVLAYLEKNKKKFFYIK